MNQPLQSAPPSLPPMPKKRLSTLAVYAISLTVILIGGLVYFIWQSYPSTRCPKPKTVQYSYDDPRDYLGPFLQALTSHDSMIVRSYRVPKSSQADKDTLTAGLEAYRNTPLTVDQWESGGRVASDIPQPDGSIRRVWTATKKVDGCWRVQRIDEELIPVR